MLEIAIYLVVLIILIFAMVKLIDKFVTPGNRKIFIALSRQCSNCEPR
jgi:hypothetical protein